MEVFVFPRTMVQHITKNVRGQTTHKRSREVVASSFVPSSIGPVTFCPQRGQVKVAVCKMVDSPGLSVLGAVVPSKLRFRFRSRPGLGIGTCPDPAPEKKFSILCCPCSNSSPVKESYCLGLVQRKCEREWKNETCRFVTFKAADDVPRSELQS
jgi:hypothetical protein